MNHRTQHNKNIILKTSINRSRLEPGSIVTFNYVDENKRASKPLVLVLNPHYKGNLHGLKLDDISPNKLQELVNVIDLWYSRRLTELLHLRLPLVKVNVGSPKLFYKTKLKHLMETKIPKLDVYREYHSRKMSSLLFVEYQFDLKVKRDKDERRRKLNEYTRLIEQKRKLEKSK